MPKDEVSVLARKVLIKILPIYTWKQSMIKSVLQSVCVLGYCLLPLGLSLAVCRIVLMAGSSTSMALFIVRCVVTLAGFVWAVYAAFQFLGDCQPANRKALAAYPMGLFYFVIAWLVVSHS